jgi:hypothetical protein
VGALPLTPSRPRVESPRLGEFPCDEAENHNANEIGKPIGHRVLNFFFVTCRASSFRGGSPDCDDDVDVGIVVGIEFQRRGRISRFKGDRAKGPCQFILEEQHVNH